MQTSGQKHKIIFLGTGPVAAASLRNVAEHFLIEAVITKARPDHHKQSAPVEKLCEEKRIPVHFVNNKAELDLLIDSEQFTSQLGLVVDFGIIISKATIDHFSKGIINSHFSLLPEWRGADPISYAILSGQAKTGVSLMLIEPTLDTGKLIAQRSLAISPKETTATLTDRLVTLSNTLLAEFLPRYIENLIIPRSQPHPSRATFSHKLTKTDAFLNWSEDAAVIERKIRAYQPWPKAKCTIGSIECIIKDADITPGTYGTPGQLTITANSLIIACGVNALALKSIQPLGKKEMPVKAFLSGYLSRLKS